MSSFNIGFLRVVKNSIAESLTSAEKKTHALTADAVESYDAASDIHKAIGAMRMIGLEGCNLIAMDVERLALAMRSGAVEVAVGKEPLMNAMSAIKRYLDDLLDGARDVPAKMFLQYQGVRLALSAEPAAPVDLFFPGFDADLAVSGEIPAPEHLERLVKSERPKFQAALVKWMKDSANPGVVASSVAQMQAVVDVLAGVGGRKSYALFWRAAGAFLSLLGGVHGDAQRSEYRGVISKLDLEMRKFAEGMKKPSDDAFRIMLFHVAQAADSTDLRVASVREMFKLEAYWAEVQRGLKESRSTLHLINIEEIKEVLGQAKDELLKVATGADGEKFKKLCAVLAGRIAGFQNPAVKKLSDSVLFVAQKVANKELRITDMISEEVAFIFVLLDGLVEKRGRTNADFDKQVDFEIKRLSAALKNQADVIQQLQTPELDEQSKRENHRVLIRHTVGEIKADLAQAEEVLDTYFRSKGENHDDLASLRKPLRSSVGAVRILGLDGAVRVLSEVARIVDVMIDGSAPGAVDLEKVTEGIGGISLYLEAFQDEADSESIMQPLLELFFGSQALAARPWGGHIKLGEVRPLAEAPPLAMDHRAEQAVQMEAQRAAFAPDTAKKSASPVVHIHEPELLAAAPVDPALARAVAAAKAPAPAAVGEWDVPSDPELAQVYLEETAEIFETIQATLVVCEAKPHDHEAMTTLRRAFHTLKGSGRMVGLNHMGEAAWGVEHFLNKWLSEDRPAARPLLDLVVHATKRFEGWVADLRASNTVLVDGSSILAMIDLLNKPAEAVAEGKAPQEQKPSSEPAPVVSVSAPADVAASPEPSSSAHVDHDGFDFLVDPISSLEYPVEEIAAAEEPVHAGEEAYAPGHKAESFEMVEEALDVEPDRAYVPSGPEAGASLGEGMDVNEISVNEMGEFELARPVVALETVSFGTLQVSRALFDIFCSESDDRLKDLELAVSLMKGSHGGPVHETLVRAAHTFGSIGRTVGFPCVSALGYEMEQWGQDKLAHNEDATLHEVELVGSAVHAIRIMVDSIKLGVFPIEENGLVRALQDAVAAAKDKRSASFVEHYTDQVVSVDADAIAADSPSSLASQPEPEADMGVEDVISVEALSSEAEGAELGFEASKTSWASAIQGAVGDIAAIQAHLTRLQETLVKLSQEVGGASFEEIKKKFNLAESDHSSPRQILGDMIGRHMVGVEQCLMPIMSVFFCGISVAVGTAEVAPTPAPTRVEDAAAEQAGRMDRVELKPERRAEPVEIELAQPVEPVESSVVMELELSLGEFGLAPVGEDAFEFDLGASLGLELGPLSGTASPAVATGDSDFVSDDDFSELAEQLLSTEDDLDESLLPVFAEEAQDLMPQISQMIRDLRGSPTDPKLINSLHRALHTVKGSARMVGALRIGTVVHHMESMMESAEHGKIAAADIVDMLESQHDVATGMLEKILRPEPEVLPRDGAAETGGVFQPTAPPTAEATLSAQSPGQKLVRVGTDIIDRLVNEAGEVRLSGAALSGGLDVMRKSLSELGENAKRLSKMLRELEMQTETQMAARRDAAAEIGLDFDPLEFDRFSRAQELSRFLAEGMHDIIDVQSNMERLVGEQDSVIVHQDQMASDIQQTLMSVRLVKFATISERLFKVVRQAAKEVGKNVRLDIVGENVEVDRGVLDRMVAPLEHLLRNAVAHGIEMPEQRNKMGKAEMGMVKLAVTHDGNFVYLKMSDDGQGLNAEVVWKKGVEKGLVSAAEAPSEARLVELIFMPGFSTAETVSQISGRGVGMDVVKNEIISLGGQIEVKTAAGAGMDYVVTLPVSLATMQAILVEASGQLWAIPAEMVEQINSYKLSDILAIQKAGEVSVQDSRVPLFPYAYLPHLLGEVAVSPEKKTYNTLVMARSGERQVALHVDRLLGTREVVVKNIGRQMSRISGISGATVMGDGRLGIIINPVYLATAKRDSWSVGTKAVGLDYIARAARPTIMVVDDSLTIRKATSKLLERSGYDVMVAKDGIDALEVLQDRLPDVILSDVEMPRMDGFELLKNLKAEPKYRSIPVVMITSRTADKHRSTGLSLGANVYLGKPYKEDELLGHIESFLKAKVVA